MGVTCGANCVCVGGYLWGLPVGVTCGAFGGVGYVGWRVCRVEGM